MANNYRGYLIKFGGVPFPNKYFLEYSSTPDQRLDTTADRDQTGYLHRSTLSDGKTSLEFTTHILHLDEKIYVQNMINRALTNPTERKVYIEYWNDETNSYDTGYFYIPDVRYQIMDATDTDILYNPITFELTEY